MLDIKKIRENKEFYVKNLSDRGVDEVSITSLIELDQARRTSLEQLEALRHQRNKASSSIQEFKKKKMDTEAEKLIEETKKDSEQIVQLEKETRQIEKDYHDLAAVIPNIAHESVPYGESEDDNTLLHQKGETPKFEFTPLPHYEVGTNLGILDFERGSKVSGPRFVYIKGLGAQLERAVYNFMLEVQTKEHGYTEVIPPYLVKEQSMFGTGQYPKFKEDVYISVK